MNRADRPDQPEPASTVPDTADVTATPLAAETPASAAATAPHAPQARTSGPNRRSVASDPSIGLAGSAADPDGIAGLVRPRRPIRVVGAPTLPEPAREPAELALRRLAIAGVSRRRMGWVAGFVISIWIVAVFARQVGDASAAAGRADQIRNDNAALAAQVAALLHERDVVQQRSFIEFQARTFGLGNAQDQRFTLSQNAPSLPPDAPGSASVRLTPDATPPTPLDSWLALLFGPSR